MSHSSSITCAGGVGLQSGFDVFWLGPKTPAPPPRADLLAG